MRTLVRFVLMLLFGFALNSCNMQQYAITLNGVHNNRVEYLQIKCFQTLSNTASCSECLAYNDKLDVYYIVNFTCPGKSKKEIYFDGKNIRGNYVFVGTYSYVNKNYKTSEERTLTVQAYMPKDNFKEYYEHNKSELKKKLDIVLSYNAMQ